MVYLILGLIMAVLSAVLRLAAIFRLAIPLIYALWCPLSFMSGTMPTKHWLRVSGMECWQQSSSPGWCLLRKRSWPSTGDGRKSGSSSNPSDDHPSPISSRISRSLILMQPTRTSMLKTVSPM